MRSYKVVCKNYVVTETICLLAKLIKSEDWSEHESIKPFDNKLSSAVKALKLYSEFYLHAGNFMLIEGAMQTPEQFMEVIHALSDVDFIYYGLSEAVDKAQIEFALTDLSALDDLDETYKGLRQEAIDLIQNYATIRFHFILAFEILNLWVQETVEKRTEHYYHFQQMIKHELSHNAPLEVAQILMGKTFKRISDYESYIFVPVCDAPFNCVRYFDDQTLIVVKNVKFPKEALGSNEIAQFMKVLSDPTRLEILHAISREPSYGIALSKRFKVSRPTISHHLEQLNSVGLVHVERVKNTKYYSMNRIRYEEIMDAFNKWFLQS
ncbi:ArsR/SmtB family transcription factor [Fusibacter ferrireducens]|uniref:Winged helix-turn-helix transcriptional regulator n=1 Tax=Fusibacter ferrireducens TaxID=2785058 RepID=A0ABR9ZZP9_9FIRM|nr:metalloregulator ArsR/SmtB family transcription factor [Fusibacter ferrireducens]MBF4695915.1 winged helix-turn-helix transcriptional regulator [Fusibacter ferrireducens]